ncbi:MAG TPA: phosphoribosylformylglycinamidine synthase subunit PurQ [Candidatus Micrarchaeia archaeon]|nr:phosphoribosylformylglycinamidine synthase subunit PurQ [Candidatus Micrarchaeia archaeon]
MRFGIVVFPGTWSDRDCAHAAAAVGAEAVTLWHADRDLRGVDCVVLPGGFAYGDYLRAGAIAAHAPIMTSVRAFAKAGGLVLGICNGFQVLCEARLLPGALLRNRGLQFRCGWTRLGVEGRPTPFTAGALGGPPLRIPIAHGEGRYHADPGTVAALEAEGRVVLRYVDDRGRATAAANPNGSLANIAGIVSRNGNVLGMMPHPERACEAVLGSVDGLQLLRMAGPWRARAAAPAAAVATAPR